MQILVKRIGIVACLAALFWPVGVRAGGDDDTTFTFQGVLKEDGIVVNGERAMRFSLWNTEQVGTGSLISGAPIITCDGAPGNHPLVSMEDGLFMARLNFESYVRLPTPLFIQVEIRDAFFQYVPQNPRTRLSSTPRAMVADHASIVDMPQWLAASVDQGPLLRLTQTSRSNTSALEIIGTSSFAGTVRFDGAIPFTVPSAVLIPNLNAERLGGELGSFYRNAGNLTGTLPGGLLNGTYGSRVLFTNEGSAFHGDFFGGGAGIFDLNAANITSGQLSDSRLSPNVCRLDATVQTLSGELRLGQSAGNLTKSFGGASVRRMIPIAYANISNLGVVESGTPNVSCSLSGNLYTIQISGETYNDTGYITVVTARPPATTAPPFVPATNAVGGNLVVRMYNTATMASAAQAFQFVMYKP